MPQIVHRTIPGIFILALAIIFPAAPWAQAADTTEAENLRALAKLYGYVRYFHPSDEVAQTNWTTFAYETLEDVRAAQTTDELEQALYDVFLPLAPTLRLEQTQSKGLPSTEPRGSGLGPTVAWQHSGVGLGAPGSYLSIRTGLADQLPSWMRIYGLWLEQTRLAVEHRGREIRLRAAARAVVDGGDESRAQLYLEVSDANYQSLFYDDTDADPIVQSEWQVREIIGTIADEAMHLWFGGGVMGTGGAWFDAFDLSVRNPGGEWQQIDLVNSSFENEDPNNDFYGWGTYPQVTDSWHASQTHCFEGNRCALIVARPMDGPVKLFDSVPEQGETISKDLGAGLRCVLPLVLGGDSWFGKPPSVPEAMMVDEPMPTPPPHTQNMWLAAIIDTWNVLQHFYPYFDVVDVDWDAELSTAIENTLAAEDLYEFYVVFNTMLAALDDGHAYAYRGSAFADTQWLPINAAWIENRVVVLTSGEDQLQVGDVIISIDGTAAEDVMADREAHISGSPQLKLYEALAYHFGVGEEGSTAEVEIDRGGDVMTLSIPRGWTYAPEETRPGEIEEIQPEVYYVDLTRTGLEAIVDRIDDLASADGVIFDLRGYPQGNHDVLSFLTDNDLLSPRWNVPLITHPDQERIEGWDTGGRWLLAPSEPRFTGRTVFLTDARAVSYAESVLGIVEAYELGDIVGRTTAGCNGDVNSFTLLGGFEVSWTGMKVLKHDGSQHHIVGIEPTLPVERTITGVRAGIDEDLETALDLILH